MVKNIKIKLWTWLGHAAHFICADKCRFRLATVVGNGKYIVSTVGEYNPYDDKKDMVHIGLGRFYETYVFRAKIDKENNCCGYSVKDWSEIDSLGANKAEEAARNHIEMCEKWDNKTIPSIYFDKFSMEKVKLEYRSDEINIKLLPK